jgi:hypothetical protein
MVSRFIDGNDSFEKAGRNRCPDNANCPYPGDGMDPKFTDHPVAGADPGLFENKDIFVL